MRVVQTLRLSIGVVDVDVPWIDQVTDEPGLVGALSLVSSVDGVGLQLCPVDVILKHSDTDDVRDATLNHYRHTKPRVRILQNA